MTTTESEELDNGIRPAKQLGDYVLIANIIRQQLDNPIRSSYGTLRQLTEKIGDAFLADNQKFDRDGFMKACGF